MNKKEIFALDKRGAVFHATFSSTVVALVNE